MKRISLIALVSVSAVLAVFASRDAQAGVRSSSVQIEQEKETVVVRIDNMQVAHNTLETRGDRIYIDLPEAAAAQQIRLQGDKTVKMVEIRDGRRPRISVKLRHGRDKTRVLGAAATIENRDGGIIMHIPRWPLPNEVVAPVPEVAAVSKTTPAEAAPTTEPAEASANEAKADAEPEATEAVAKTEGSESAEAEAAPVGKPNSSEGGVSFGPLFGVVLLLAGGGIIVWRSRQSSGESVDLEAFRVIASKQLGGKSKVVWLGVGSREMVVSVGEAGTQLLSEWTKNQPPAALGTTPSAGLLGVAANEPKVAPTLVDMQDGFAIGTPPPPAAKPPAADPTANTVYDFRSTLSTAAKAQADIAAHLKQRAAPAKKRAKGSRPAPVATGENSPSVAGLLKLRDQAPKVSVEVATEDPEADAEWARELFKATRESVLRRMD